jgi:hypothetical protein
VGSAALAVASTLVGAVIAQSRGAGAVRGRVAAAAHAVAAGGGTRDTIAVAGRVRGARARLLVAYALALLAAGLLLYDHLWED